MSLPRDLLEVLQPFSQMPLMSPAWRKILLTGCFIFFAGAVVLAFFNYRLLIKDMEETVLLGVVLGSVLAYGVFIPSVGLLIATLISLVPVKAIPTGEDTGRLRWLRFLWLKSCLFLV